MPSAPFSTGRRAKGGAPVGRARKLEPDLDERVEDLEHDDESGGESESDIDSAASDSDANSGPDDDSRSAASDSDSLDSAGPRKRRRTSPPAARDAEPRLITSAFSVPSRIKRNTAAAETTRPSDPDPSADPEPASGVTAPLDLNTTFDSLGLRPWLVQSLANMAIKRPTSIQRESIPMLLKGRDCIGGSRTGSGKTVAFAAPILQRWAENPSAIFAVILTPTRYVSLAQLAPPPPRASH